MNFQGRRDQNGTGWGQLIQIAKTGQSAFVGPVHQVVTGKHGILRGGLTGVCAHCFGTNARHVALFREKSDRGGVPAGTVVTVFSSIQKVVGVTALGLIGPV